MSDKKIITDKKAEVEMYSGIVIVNGFKIHEKGKIVSYKKDSIYSNKNKASIDYLIKTKKLR